MKLSKNSVNKICSYFAGKPVKKAFLFGSYVRGEGTARSVRDKYKEMPWREIIGLRIIVIHEYFGVDEIVIWEIIQSDLPRFRGQLLEIIETL